MMKIVKYKSDMEGMWEKCDCPEFESDFSRSTTIYIAITAVMGAIALIQFVPSVILVCRKPKIIVEDG